jgi:hypothetical protein
MHREKNQKDFQEDSYEQLQPPQRRQREEEVVKTIKAERLSPLKYQRHADRTGRLSVNRSGTRMMCILLTLYSNFGGTPSHVHNALRRSHRQIQAPP